MTGARAGLAPGYETVRTRIADGGGRFRGIVPTGMARSSTSKSKPACSHADEEDAADLLAQSAASLAERFDPVPDSVVDAARAVFASRAASELGRDGDDADSGGGDNDDADGGDHNR